MGHWRKTGLKGCVVAIAIAVTVPGGLTATAETVAYTDEAAFLAAATPTRFESFEDESVTGAVANLATTHFTVRIIPLSGDSTGVLVGDSPGWASDGDHYLGGGAGGPNPWRLDFTLGFPVYAIGFDVMSASESRTQSGDTSVVRLDMPSGEQFVMSSCPPCLNSPGFPGNRDYFFGVVSDTPFSTFSIVNTAYSDGVAFDKMQFAPVSSASATIQSESFDSAATAAANGWSLQNGAEGWGWQNSNYAGGAAGEARASTYSAGTQRWYADTDLGGALTFTEDWQASGLMDFNQDSRSDGGMFFGFFNRDTSLTSNTQTLAGFLLVNGQLRLRFERRPNTADVETMDFGLWVNGDHSFKISYDADGAAPGIGRLSATISSLTDPSTSTRSLDIDHSLVAGATLNSFGFYAMDFAPGRYTPVGWAVDDLSYGPPASLELKTSMIAGCRSATGTVTLSNPAPAGGMFVMLSDNLVSATTPATLYFSAGSRSKTFAVRTTPVASLQSGDISVIVDGLTTSRALTVRPMGLTSMTLTPTSVVGSQPVTGKATLECNAGPGPITVDLSSNNSAVASPVAASIVVPQGVKTANFDVTTNAVQARSYATIAGTANGVAKSKRLTVNVAAVVSATRLGFGNVAVGTTSGPLNATVTNRGAVPFSVTGISLTGTGGSWFAQTNNCPANLASGASCTISVTFTPLSAASKSAKLSIATTATSTALSVSLSGMGI